MRLSELLTPAAIKIGLHSEDKRGLFQEMVQMLVSANLIRDGAAAVRALWEREAKLSTGIAPAVALPHGKLAEARRLLLAAGTSDAGIAYESLDGARVHVVFMVFAEVGNPGPHIAALAEISRLFAMPGFTGRVREARTAADLVRLVSNAE